MDRTRLAYVSAAAVAAGTAIFLAWRWWSRRQGFRPPTKWRRVGELSDLICYPVKSLGPIRLNSMECTNLGLKNGWLRDRTLMVIDLDGQFVTGRQYPRMVQDREEDMVVWLNENKLELGDVLDDFLDDIPSEDFFKYGHANMYGYQKNTISTKDYIDDLKRAYCLLKQLSSFEEDFSTDYLSKLMRLSVFYRAPLHMLESLHEKGADVWLKDKEGKSLLFYATKGYAKRMNYHALHYLIKVGLDVSEIVYDGSNVLHWIYDSIFTCDYVENLKETVDDMLELGADVNIEDNNGCTPLATLDKTCKILYHSHLVKAVALLLARDAYVNPKNLQKIRDVPLYHSYFRRCEEELISLKQTKVHDNFSYFDVLAKEDYSLALCLRNRDVSGKLYKALKYDYPDIQYSNLLWRKYKRARKLTDRLEKTCSLLSDILIPYCLPIEIVEKITFHCTQCLTEQDFEKLFDEKSTLELTDG